MKPEQAIADIDRLLANAVADGTAPGFVGALANRNRILHCGAHGGRAADGPQAMTMDTVFWIASMTKLVTAVAAMQLVESGDLALDAPVAALLPELANPQVLDGFSANGRVQIRPARGAITLRHLLTHTSGSGYEAMNPSLLAARGPAGPPPPTSLTSLQGPLAHDPGAGWTYGYGLDWAGIAIERASGRSLDRYFADAIFVPLGMRDTGFAVPPQAVKRAAAMHTRDAAGGSYVIPSLVGAPQDWEFCSGGAGLFGTAIDYLRLTRMLLLGGELEGTRILQEATVAMMGENQIGNLSAGRLATANPALVLPFDPVPGQACGWSLLGVRNPERSAAGRSAGSAAWAGLGGTFFWIDRAADLCGVLCAQILPFGDPALGRVQHDFERAAYAGAAGLGKQRTSNAA